jgi:hypothetical protein
MKGFMDISTKEYQMEKEFEMIKLGLQAKQNLTVNLRIASIEFKREIEEITQAIMTWRKADRFRGSERRAYSVLLDTLPPHVLAENIIYAILEHYLTNSESAPLAVQHVVNNGLIRKRLKALLPKEETAIPLQYKFKIVDMMVTRAIYLLPSLFTLKNEYQAMASIELTKKAKSRLADVDTRSILFDSPMYCKPADWTSVFHGGYLTPEMQRASPLIGSMYHNYKELIAVDKSLQENPEILQAVNKMQSVAFKIDRNYEKYHKTIDDFRVVAIKKVEKNLSKIKAEILKLEEELKLAESTTEEA